MPRRLRTLLRPLLPAAPLLALAACTAPCDYGAGDVLPVAMRGRAPFVTAELNGNRAPLLLDTGASHTLLTPEGAAALRLQPDRLRSSSGSGVGGTTRGPNALLASLRLGRHSFRNLTVPVAGISLPGQRVLVGVVGADLLRASELEMDLSAGRVTLHDRRACRMAALPWEGGYDTIPVRVTPAGLVVLPVLVNGRELGALFDSGAGASVLRRSEAGAIGVTEEALSRLPVGSIIGFGTRPVEVRMLSGATIRVGAETVEGATLGLADLPSGGAFDMILGQDYIAGRRFWLSYAESRLYVQRPASASPASASPASASPASASKTAAAR